MTSSLGSLISSPSKRWSAYAMQVRILSFPRPPASSGRRWVSQGRYLYGNKKGAVPLDKWEPGQESNLIGRLTTRLSPSASALNQCGVILFGRALISLRASASEKRLSSNSAFHQLQSARVWGELRVLCFLSKLSGKNAQTAVWVRFWVLHQLIPDW